MYKRQEQLSARAGIYAHAPAEAARLRHEALVFRKQLIELSVDTGQLSMEDYLAQLRQAIALEQKLAMAHKAAGSVAGKQRAVHALKRVKVMRVELLGAEAAEAASGGEGEFAPAGVRAETA